MENKYLKVFEIYFLKPIDFLFIGILFYYLINGVWLLFGLMIVINLYNGWIGADIANKNKTLKELAKGTTPNSWKGYSNELTYQSSRELAKATVFTSFGIAITLIVLAFYYGYKFYVSIPLGIICGVIINTIFSSLTIYLTPKIK